MGQAAAPPHTYEHVKAAAVAGRAINLTLLEHISPGSGELAWLLECQERMVAEANGEMWRFTHDKIREAVIRDLTDDERVAYNQRAALAIEALFPGNDDYAEALANHWRAAGNPERERHYSYLVARRYLDSGSGRFAEAKRLLERTRALLDGEEMLGAVLAGLAEAQTRLSDVEGARAVIAELRAYAARTNRAYDAAMADFWEGNVAQSINIYPQALAAMVAARAGFAALGDTVMAMRALSFELLTQYNLDRFSPALREQILVAIDTFKQAGSQGALLTAMAILMMFERHGTSAQRSNEIGEELLAIATKANDQYAIARALGDMAVNHAIMGDLHTAREVNLKALAAYKRWGNLTGMAASLGNGGRMAMMLNEPLEALRMIEEARGIELRLGDAYGASSSQIYLAETYLTLGQPAEATRHAREAAESMRRLGDRDFLLMAQEKLAISLELQGQTDEAIAVAREAYDHAHLSDDNAHHLALMMLRHMIEPGFSLRDELAAFNADISASEEGHKVALLIALADVAARAGGLDRAAYYIGAVRASGALSPVYEPYIRRVEAQVEALGPLRQVMLDEGGHADIAEVYRAALGELGFASGAGE